MSMTRSEISAVVAAAQPYIIGGWIQKIQQPDDRTLAFDIRTPGRSVWLVISTAHRLSRIHLSDDKPEKTPSPPRFCQAARKHLGGKIIKELTVDPSDRIIRMTAVNSEESCLFIGELFGNNGNLIIVGSDGLTIDAARRKAGLRPVQSGEPYLAPEILGKKGDETIRSFGEGELPFAVGEFYSKRAAELQTAELKEKLGRVLERHRKRTANYLESLSTELQNTADPLIIQNLADHLAANLYRVKRGDSLLTVANMLAEGEVTIPLDPALGASQNLEKLYHRARRNRKRQERIRERIDEMQRLLKQLDAWLEEFHAASNSPEVLRRIEERLIHEGLAPTSKTSRTESPPDDVSSPHRFLTKDGSEIFVGRNAADNDDLTFHVARGNDWWFHVVGFPSSHVIVKASAKGHLQPDTILDAATVTLLNSKLSRQNGGEVMYTQAKYVRKPKGAAPGKVIAEQTKTIFIRIDNERVERLYRDKKSFSGR